jgi:hypothetical protein
MGRAAIAMFLLTACGRGDARQLLESLQDDDYRSYRRAPGWETPRVESSAPHSNFVDIYIDDTLADALDEGTPLDRWPDGSIIVKDGWTRQSGGDLAIIAVMEKRGDAWFFAEYKGNGRVLYAGENDRVCVGCHDGDNDRVLAFDLPGG